MAYVYRHIRLDKNVPFYIGICSKYDKYRRAFDTTDRRNKIWGDIANKTQYDVEILFDDITMEQAIKKEIEFISMYGRIDKKTGSLANLTDGGEGSIGVIHSEERKLKARQRMLGKKIGLGNKHTEEWKIAMSLKRKGKKYGKAVKHTEETKRKIGLASVGRKHNVGRVWTENQKAKLKGRVMSEDTKQKMKISKTGFKHSEESKTKMREKAMGNTNAKGYRHSEYSKTKMSNAKKGKNVN